MEMSVELFDSIINTSQDCVFWKDKERRFLGVNRAFLDYYGFESADVLIGKTDEDMGWHSDPEPFKQDELRVLSGRSTYKVQGKCVIRGEERDIIASKRPLYENGKIVGLVGSFVDVTDVIRRRHGLNGGQVVYTIDHLRKYAFFDRLIDEISLEEILDPLTGVLSRSYAMKFVRALIAEGTPFTFAMFDLDNFKHINDRFGHSAGDTVLKSVSERLAQAADGAGMVGRFGGDELLMINLRDTEMKDKAFFFESLYTKSNALRFEEKFENGAAYITGTVGAATFPQDADNYADLFGLIDKMLYLGKGKGRNCYSIYDEKEHREVMISKIAANGVFDEMHAMRHAMDRAEGFLGKLKAVMPRLTEMLMVRDLYYTDENGRMKAVLDPAFEEDIADISGLMREDVFSEGNLERVKTEAPVFYDVLKRKGLGSVLIMRMQHRGNSFGYLICAAERSFRIWQENERAILYYLAGLLERE